MGNEITDGYVKSHTEHGVSTIEFFHPQSNSLPGNLLGQINQELHFLSGHGSKVVILQSAGNGAFCAGASFNELASIKTESEAINFFKGFASLINGMRKCKMLIIGRIHGKCVGGGVGIAAACDYSIATNAAEVKLSELSIGLGPFVVGPAIERKIGVSAFSQLAIDATLWRNSEWAKKKGLFAEVHETAQDMDESVYRLANTLSHANNEAISQMKQMFWQGTDHWDQLLNERAAISGRLVLSDFAKNAIAEFTQKIKK
ncbi:MAG: enoyl-CoA hydratase/isomerase family protein [Ginsengibacter sp.]